jgi:hypothetical protein
MAIRHAPPDRREIRVPGRERRCRPLSRTNPVRASTPMCGPRPLYGAPGWVARASRPCRNPPHGQDARATPDQTRSGQRSRGMCRTNPMARWGACGENHARRSSPGRVAERTRYHSGSAALPCDLPIPGSCDSRTNPADLRGDPQTNTMAARPMGFGTADGSGRFPRTNPATHREGQVVWARRPGPGRPGAIPPRHIPESHRRNDQPGEVMTERPGKRSCASRRTRRSGERLAIIRRRTSDRYAPASARHRTAARVGVGF